MVQRHSSHRSNATLHWLMIVLPAVLFVVSVGTAFQSGRFPTSISAFYGGPVRDVFVGVLIALAACMIAYQGSNPVEHYNLKGAAFYAIFVALVPTGLGDILDDLSGRLLLAPDGVTPSDYVWSLRFSLSIAAVLCLMLISTEVRQMIRRRSGSDTFAIGFVIVTVSGLVLFLALAMWQLWEPAASDVTMAGISLAGFQLRIHDIAAIFLLTALAVAVWSHAWPHASARRVGELAETADVALKNRYRAIFVLMVTGPLFAWGLSAAFAPGYFILLLEWWEIALFSVFWAFETRRLRRDPLLNGGQSGRKLAEGS